MTVSLQGSCENSSDVVHTCHLSVINHLITQSHERQLRTQQNNPVTPTLILDPQNNKQNCCHFVQMLCSWSHIVQFVNALARFDCKGQQSDLTNYNEMTSVAVELFINIELQQRQGDIIRTTWLQIVLLSSRRFGCTVLFVILIYSVYKKRHWA